MGVGKSLQKVLSRFLNPCGVSRHSPLLVAAVDSVQEFIQEAR